MEVSNLIEQKLQVRCKTAGSKLHDLRAQITLHADDDSVADPNDSDVATISLEFKWVKPCLNRNGGNRRGCSECRKSGGSARDSRGQGSRYAPYQRSNFERGVVHERAKKANGMSVSSQSYHEGYDSDGEDGESHGTFKKRTLFRFSFGPRGKYMPKSINQSVCHLTVLFRLA
jgi:hypothetical protein